MRIKDFQLNKCRRRRQLWRRRLLLALLFDLDECILRFTVHKVMVEDANIARHRLRRMHVQTSIFNLNSFSDHQCLVDFRFKREDIGMLCELFDWPGISSRSEYRCNPITAMCVFLHRLATTSRWFDLEKKFGLFTSQLCELFWEHVELCVEKYGKTLEMKPNFFRQRASLYASTLCDNGSPLDSLIGFIDCTKIRIARPGGPSANQQAVYSGHKRMHCLTYQTISTPDGLIAALYGPVEGRRHDLTLLRQSGWEYIMSESFNVDGRQFYIYGDSAYLLRPWMQRPFLTAFASLPELRFNADMSSLRVLVEHNYRDLKQFWCSQDFARNLKVRLSPVGLLYKSSAIMLNLRTCLYQGGQTFLRFGLAPPSISELIAF